MILSEMQIGLRGRIGNPDPSEVDDNQLTRHLNQAYDDIADRYRFHKARKRCQFLTIAGVARYDLPSDVLEVYRLADMTNFKKLEKIGDRQLSSRTDDSQGKPEKYVRYRDWVELSPTPDADGYVIEVYYKYRQVPLSAPTDTPGIPPTWHIGIVMLAAWYYYDEVNDQPKAATRYNAFKTWLSDKPTEIDEESKADIDSGVEVVPLSTGIEKGLTFDESP